MDKGFDSLTVLRTVILVLLVALVRLAEADTCATNFNGLPPILQDLDVLQEGNTRFKVTKPVPGSNLKLFGDVEYFKSEKSLVFNIQTRPKTPSGPIYIDHEFTGAQVFMALYREILKRGLEVQGIQGVWLANSDNLKTFNRTYRNSSLLSNPERLAEAARSTFTGKMTTRLGFTEVKFESYSLDPYGRFTQVEVLFFKPSSP